MSAATRGPWCEQIWSDRTGVLASQTPGWLIAATAAGSRVVLNLSLQSADNMAILERWPDGFILDMDPRREDPLYYYRREDDWSGAIGFEVLPLYRERDSEQVELSVFEGHRERELELSDTERELLYSRAVPALAGRHDSWKRISLKAVSLGVVLGSGSLADGMLQVGFVQGATDDRIVLWTRL